MFFLILLVFAGAAYNAVYRSNFVQTWIAVTIVAFFPAMILLWVSDTLGISTFITSSWQFLSGVQTPGDIVPECPFGQQTGWVIPLLLLSLINVVPGGAAIVCLPIGIAWTVVGGVRYLAKKEIAWMRSGIKVVCIGLIGLITAGLIMRLIHGLYSSYGCG